LERAACQLVKPSSITSGNSPGTLLLLLKAQDRSCIGIAAPTCRSEAEEGTKMNQVIAMRDTIWE
jgi:hypothetical protein